MLLLYKEGGESAVALYSRRGECCCSIKEMMKNMPGKVWLSPPPPHCVLGKTCSRIISLARDLGSGTVLYPANGCINRTQWSHGSILYT